MLTVQITGATHDHYWYSRMIGQKFTVKDGESVYYVVDQIQHGQLIDKRDCIVVTE